MFHHNISHVAECDARAVNEMIQTASVSFVGTYVLAYELCDFMLCKMKQKVSLVLLMVQIKWCSLFLWAQK